MLNRIDKLVDNAAGNSVKIGEALDGRVLIRNLSTRHVGSAGELQKYIAVASSRRATAPTERNRSSSRSHGVAILTIGQPGMELDDPGAPQPGVLMLIDLAGSERAADSKCHSKAPPAAPSRHARGTPCITTVVDSSTEGARHG